MQSRLCFQCVKRYLKIMIETMRRKIFKIKSYKTPILTILGFILGCMLTINIIPIDKTCRIENTDREYNIMQNEKFKNPDLIVLILSAPKNLERRNIIRQTWLTFIDDLNLNVRFKMKHYFVVGSAALTVDEILHLSSEQSLFNDILILPIHDSYQNLSLKVVKSFEWLNTQFDYGLVFKYVLKCDDDSFVRLDKIPREILDIEALYLEADLIEADRNRYMSFNIQKNSGTASKTLELYWGYFNGNARIKTKGKWKEDNWIVCDKYVPYALGGGYILSKSLITIIALNSAYLRFYNAEDVSVGLWLAPVSNILRIHDTRFDTEWTTRGCQNHYLITHAISMTDMQVMYNNIVNSNTLCQRPTSKRLHYLYNWSSPPSQCCEK